MLPVRIHLKQYHDNEYDLWIVVRFIYVEIISSCVYKYYTIFVFIQIPIL